MLQNARQWLIEKLVIKDELNELIVKSSGQFNCKRDDNEAILRWKIEIIHFFPQELSIY